MGIGFAGFGGVYDTIPSAGNNKFEIGPGYGAGIIVETMFTNTLGIHTGIWFTEIKSRYYFQGVVEKWVDYLSREISLPLYLILSYNKGPFTFNFLTGIKAGYIFQTQLAQDDEILGHAQIDVIEEIGHYQFGLGIGINLKFKMTQFVDIFFGILTEFYVTDLILESGGPESYDHIINGKFMMGCLFRTNLFPM